MIEPTVGRIVYYHSKDKPDQSLAAIITGVVSSPNRAGMTLAYYVNLAVFGFSGDYKARTNVRLVQPGEQLRSADHYCEWMPYQIKKDYGSESGEKEAGIEEISPLI